MKIHNYDDFKAMVQKEIISGGLSQSINNLKECKWKTRLCNFDLRPSGMTLINIHQIAIMLNIRIFVGSCCLQGVVEFQPNSSDFKIVNAANTVENDSTVCLYVCDHGENPHCYLMTN